ncbi:MAG: PAS domain-containing protein [Terrimicrobiaceae bacterium]|nr:PAS domain-containing protein [Terrimicrobiaceae bacterium]
MFGVIPFAMALKSNTRHVSGLRRLLDDLALSHPPVELPRKVRASLLRRIEAEPARVETDARGRIVATNPAFSALCGYAFHEIRGRKPGSFLQGEATEPEAVERLRRAIQAKLPVQVEMTNYHKNGSTYRVQIAIEPVFDASGRHTGFRAVERKL